MEFHEAVRAHHGCTQFQTRPIPDEKLRAVLAAARLAPSQNNFQPWRFIVVRDDEQKRKVAQACPKGKPVAEAPVVIIALSVEEDIPVTIAGYISAYPLDVAVAIHTLRLAATAEGLGTQWIVDFHEEKIRGIFGVPEGIHPIAVIPLGFPAENAGPTNGSKSMDDGRKSQNEIIAYNEYPW
jgi:nitroreductase